jgi:hypothetical protein
MSDSSSILADLETIQGHLGSAILDLSGTPLRLRGQMTEGQASTLFSMVVEVGMLKEESFERLTVAFSSCHFSVVRDESHIYMIQTKA